MCLLWFCITKTKEGNLPTKFYPLNHFKEKPTEFVSPSRLLLQFETCEVAQEWIQKTSAGLRRVFCVASDHICDRKWLDFKTGFVLYGVYVPCWDCRCQVKLHHGTVLATLSSFRGKLGQISSPKQSKRAIQHKMGAVSREIIVTGSLHFITLSTSTVSIDSLNCQWVLRLALVINFIWFHRMNFNLKPFFTITVPSLKVKY